MTTRSLFSAAFAVSLLSIAAHAGPFAEVSTVEARQVLSVISTARGGFSGMPQSSLDVLKNLDPKVPGQRAMLGPLNEALAQIYEEGGDKAGVFTRALRIVGARSESLLAAAQKDDASSAQLGETVEQLEQLRRLMAFYKPAEAAGFDTAVAQARQAYEAKKSADLAASGAAIAGGIAAQAPVSAPQPAPIVLNNDGQTLVLQSVIEQLRQASFDDEREKAVRRLEGFAKGNPSEAAQLLAARALGEQVQGASFDDERMLSMNALERIARASQFAGVRLAAVEEIAEFTRVSTFSDEADKGRLAIKRVAVESEPAVKGAAISRLLGDLEGQTFDDDKDKIQNRIDAIAKSHSGGLAAIPVPSVETGSILPKKEAGASPLSSSSWHLSANASLFLKVAAGLLGYLICLKITPPGVLTQVTGEITMAAFLNFFFPKSDRKLDVALFALFIAAIVATPLLAPPGFIVEAVGAIGTAYFLALFFL